MRVSDKSVAAAAKVRRRLRALEEAEEADYHRRIDELQNLMLRHGADPDAPISWRNATHLVAALQIINELPPDDEEVREALETALKQ